MCHLVELANVQVILGADAEDEIHHVMMTVDSANNTKRINSQKEFLDLTNDLKMEKRLSY